MNIGNNRSAMGDHRASIGFYGRAAAIAGRMNDSIRIASALMNEGIAFSSLKSFDSSRLRLNEALHILPARNGELAKLQILFNMATLSEKQGMLATAEADYRRVADGARGLGDPVAIGMANSGLAGVLGQTGRLGAAIRLIEGTIRQLDSIGLGHYALDLTDKLVSMYKLAGRYPEALAASEHRKLLMDSLISEENRTSVRELEVKYQTALKASENLKLKQEARVRNLVGIGLLLIVAALIPLMLVLRQRNRYHRALNGTYERLISE
jgi:tetratricopeptide (TPR) repeat protein